MSHPKYKIPDSEKAVFFSRAIANAGVFGRHSLAEDFHRIIRHVDYVEDHNRDLLARLARSNEFAAHMDRRNIKLANDLLYAKNHPFVNLWHWMRSL